MVIVRGILGFLFGLIVCGILLFLISITTPMPDVKSNIATNVRAVTPVLPEPLVNNDEFDDFFEFVNEKEPQALDTTDSDNDRNQQKNQPQQQLQQQNNQQIEDSNSTIITQQNIDVANIDIKNQKEAAVDAGAKVSPSNNHINIAAVVPDASDEATTMLPRVHIGTDIGKKISNNRLKSINFFSSSSTSESQSPRQIKAFDSFSQTSIIPNAPVLAIILQDIGALGVTRRELLQSSFALTYVISADKVNASQIAQDYFAAGYEVLISNPMKKTPAPNRNIALKNIDATFKKVTNIVPSAVGFIDNSLRQFQKNIHLQRKLFDYLETSGHALILFNQGLNSTVHEARKRNLPVGSIFRILDQNNEDISTINRYLNHAVLKAKQDGAAIVLGTTAAKTFNAIQKWLETNNIGKIVLAPVSVAIRVRAKRL